MSLIFFSLGSDNVILPAAAVVGAATAFGLASLLPLNVPANKPLMYCNATEITQTQIKLEGNIYSCVNNSIAISCQRVFSNFTADECANKNQTMECDLADSSENLYCTNATLISRQDTLCNSTTVLNGTNVNITTTILNCYPGMLNEKLAAFIPTTTTVAPITTTTERSLSLGAQIHVFFLHLAGKSDVLVKPPTTTVEPPTEDPRLALKDDETPWIPEALTIPPETTTTEVPSKTTSEAPYYWGMKLGNGEHMKISEDLLKYMIDPSGELLYGMGEYYEKVYVSTTEANEMTTSEATTEKAIDSTQKASKVEIIPEADDEFDYDS